MATFKDPTWLYHPTDGAKLFMAGAERPGEPWADSPFDGNVTDDPAATELTMLRHENGVIKAEIARLEALVVSLKRKVPSE